MNKLSNVVIVDDEPEICAAIKRSLMRVEANISTFTSPRQALSYIKDNELSIIISDQRMPDIDGYTLLSKIKKLKPKSVRVMLSAYQDFEQVSKSFNEGVIDKFIAKPWKNIDLVFAVESAIKQPVKHEPNTLNSQFVSQEIIGDSSVMGSLKQQIALASGANVPIFVHGETGTGKELVAKACHQASSRASFPFVAVNCANFSEQLIDAQLFGAVKGAYTGAIKDSQGIFSQADGGTVFLDEITTLPLNIQAKLLRVLQEREYTPVGGSQSKSFDTQIVSASSVKLADAVKAGDFREDLFYRLNVIPLSIPALRNRSNDVLQLAYYFLNKYTEDQGKTFVGFSESALAYIQQYTWPGNVRQLENTIHGAIIMNQGNVIDRFMLEGILAQHIDFKSVTTEATETIEHIKQHPTNHGQERVLPLADIERRAIETAIAQCDGNISRAAALLEVNPSTIYRKMQKW